VAITVAMELPTHLASAKPNLDPYGQLLRMLMPRALGIGFYDARGAPLWVAAGYDGPDPAPLVAAALTQVPPATTGRIDGFSQDHEGAPAYVFRLRSDEGDVIAIATLLTRDGEKPPVLLRAESRAARARVPAARARGSHERRCPDARPSLARRRPRPPPQDGT
jgi:hypothetical protein